MLVPLHLIPLRSLVNFNAAGENTDTYIWNNHDSDWIYPGGPSPSNLHGPDYNALGDLDDSPVTWKITEPVDSFTPDTWIDQVGNFMY